MTNPNCSLSTAATLHSKLREWLKEQHELEDGDPCLIDSLEGISPMSDVIVALARDARWREAQADACDVIIKETQARKARFEASAAKTRNAIAHAMQEAGEKKITAPDMTLSLGAGRRKVITLGEPNAFTCEKFVVSETKYRWNKDELAKGLEQGDPAAQELAQFSNAVPVLTIRVK